MGSANTVAGEQDVPGEQDDAGEQDVLGVQDDHLVSNSVLAGQLPPLLPVFPLHLVALYNPK